MKRKSSRRPASRNPSRNPAARTPATQGRLLPPVVGTIFARGIMPLFFLGLSIACLLLLKSYSPLDPSLNSIGTTSSSSDTVQNSLGIAGAIIADILWQLFGVTSYTLVLLGVLWAILWMRTSYSFEPISWQNRAGRVLLVAICTTSSLILLATIFTLLFGGKAFYGGWFGSGIVQLLQNSVVQPWSGLVVAALSLLCLVLFLSAARLPMSDYAFSIRLFGALLWWLALALFQALRRGGQSSINQLGQHRGNPDVTRLFTPGAMTSESTKPFVPSKSEFDGLEPASEPASTLRTAPEITPAADQWLRVEPNLDAQASSGRVEPTLEQAEPFSPAAPDARPAKESPAEPFPQQPSTEPAFTAPPIPPETAFADPENTLDVAPINKPDMTDLSPATAAGPAKKTQQSAFVLPGLDLLSDPPPHIASTSNSDEELQANARHLEEVLSDFNIKGEIQQIRPGPVVTMYELEPAPGIKTTRIINLSEDIARNMRALSVRIATIPGHSALGIELPNARRLTVNMKEILGGRGYQDSQAKLPMILGKKIDGVPLIVDLATMPHLLIAGTTGSGKSVGLNVMLLSILYRLTPDQCRIIMIDPKMLEFSVYDGIPHLLTPVVTEPKQAVVALKWTVREMENRYRLMSKVGVRNIDGFNQRVAEARERGEPIIRKIHAGYDTETGEAIYDSEEIPREPFPLIVVVVDEMADLMIVAGKEIEALIQRLAQMARAAGIHLIMATQRPSVDVITGTIKANFPTRISYRVTSKIDSRTIIGEMGAEQLLGRGDLLLMQAAGNITRVHAPFVEDTEVEKICHWLRQQRPPSYLEDVIDEGAINQDLGDVSAAMFDADGNEDEASLYDKAVAVVAHHQKASTSFIQRQLRIGYNRAADLIDEMENQGVISAANHAGKREVLIRDFES